MARAALILLALCSWARAQDLEPPAPSKAPRRQVDSAMSLSREKAVDPDYATYDGSPKLPGSRASSSARLGVTGPKLRAPVVEKESAPAPRFFSRAPIAADSLALAREAPENPDAAPPIDRRYAIAGIAALFAACYFFLSRALRRGPGGRGLTHD
jgi:hypothetical protein